MAEKKRKIKMADVAREVGVSTTVVSRVLNGLQGVNDATRERVLEAIRTMDYQPDPRGRRQKPASDRHRRILTLFIGNSLERLPPVYLEVISGIGASLSEKDFAMELKCVMPDEELDVERLVGCVDGMIFFGGVQRFNSFRRLSQRLPVIEAMGEFAPLDSWDHVSYDNQAVGPLAASYLLERGHLNCAVVTSGSATLSPRVATFKTAVEAAGGSVQEYHLAHWNPGERLDLANRATGPERVTGIFAVADNLLKCIYTGLQHHQLQVGRDVDLVSCNREYPLLQGHTLLPAEIDIHPEQVGRRAVRQLFWRLEHPRELTEKVTIAIELLPPEKVAKLMHEHAAHIAKLH